MSGGRRVSEFERLTQPGSRLQADDDTIPVLTERLSLPSLEIDTSLPPSAPAAGSPATATPDEEFEHRVEAAPSTVFPGEERADVEAVEPEPIRAPEPVPAEESAAPSPAPAEIVEKAAPGAEELDWTEIEERARDALLHELQPRLASELDRHLRERLQPTLVRMLLATVTELRPSLEAAVRESVERAVAAEIARQRSRQ